MVSAVTVRAKQPPRRHTLVQGVIIPKHFLEYSVLIGGSANSTLGFRSSTTSYGKVELSCLGIITPDTKYFPGPPPPARLCSGGPFSLQGNV